MKQNRWSFIFTLLFAAGTLIIACSGGTSGGSNGPAQTPSLPPTGSGDTYLQVRLEMVKETIEQRGVSNPDVLRSLRTVPGRRLLDRGRTLGL